MSDQSLSYDTDLVSDGGTHHFKSDLLDAMVYDDRQLSSELESTLRIVGNEAGSSSDFTARGVEDGHVVPKKETQDPCMFTTQQPYPRQYFAGSNNGSVNPQFPKGEMFNDPSLYNYSMVGGYNMPSCDQWRQAQSLSSCDLEMDRAPSMTLDSQTLRQTAPTAAFLTKGENNGQYGSHMQQSAFQNYGNPPRYSYEQKLSKYEEVQSVSDTTVNQHEEWQSNQYVHTSETCSQNFGGHGDDGAMVIEEENVPHTFEMDEAGEGPLHTLSLVQDKTLMAKAIDVLQKCGLVEQCINLQNKHKQTPLFLAVQAGNIALCGWLLQNGADPNIQGTLYMDREVYIWRSPLHLVAMNGDAALGILNLLLTKSHRTDINIQSHGDKLTALHVALKHHTETHSCKQIILTLLEKKADISIREHSSSKTPFIMAIETRDISLVKDFLDRFSAERIRHLLQEQTRAGDTCLHIAAGLSRIQPQQKVVLLRLLVTNGANGNIQNNVKEVPRDFARAEWDKIRNF